MDVDAGSPGNTGLAVENISWVTAPSGTYRVAVKNYGSCSPSVDYTLYIKLDGQMYSYDRVAPAGDNGKYEIVSFTWSAGARSAGAGEFDTYTLAIADKDAGKA